MPALSATEACAVVLTMLMDGMLESYTLTQEGPDGYTQTFPNFPRSGCKVTFPTK